VIDVSARVLELRMEMSNQVVAGLVAPEVANKNARMAELQQRWDWLRDALECLTEERGAALADEAPGGSTGLLIKRYSQGQAIYMVDMRVLALIRLLLKHEKRAAEELGQWGEKTSPDRGSESRRPDLSKLTPEELRTMIHILEKTEASQADGVAEEKHMNADERADVKHVDVYELDQIIERALHAPLTACEAQRLRKALHVMADAYRGNNNAAILVLTF